MIGYIILSNPLLVLILRTLKRPMPNTIPTSHSKDAERKRVARAMRKPVLPANFCHWFKESVDEIPPSRTDSRVWDVRLAKVMGAGVETDKALRRYYGGEIKRPRADAAYEIGWGLNDLGLRWCSGPVSLLAAGYTEQFLRLVACLSAQGVLGREAALRFAFGASAANAPITLNGNVLSTADARRRKGFILNSLDVRAFARSEVAVAAQQRDAISAASEAAGSQWPRNVGLDFKFAFNVFKSGPFREELRLALALTIIADYIKNSDRESEWKIARPLIPFSPMARFRKLVDNTGGLA
jgi:hypothetical protein